MLPVQVTIRDIPSSQALETHIRQKVEKLNKHYDRISSCRVVVEFAQKHKHRGKLYNARLDVTVPGKELAVTKKTNEDIYVAIRDAFAAIIRQLEDLSRKRHGQVKNHTDLMQGRIVRLNKEDGYGFISGADGNEYYFSITNMSHPSFERLTIGDSVHYMPMAENDGWQAHHVKRDRNHVLDD